MNCVETLKDKSIKSKAVLLKIFETDYSKIEKVRSNPIKKFTILPPIKTALSPKISGNRSPMRYDV